MAKQRNFPRTTKRNTVGKYGKLICATACMQGWREDMEDNHDVSLSLPGQMKRWVYAGIFDGHGGKKVSKHCSKHLCKQILTKVRPFGRSRPATPNVTGSIISNEQQLEDTRRIRDGITEGFLQQDQNMRENTNIDDESGSTAVCTLFSPNHCYIANCGDSRAILCRDGKVGFATKDHKPENKAEKRRILRAGGFVRRMRVNGRLALSRAMGDFDFKENRDKSPCSQMVIPKPDVTVLERNQEADEFVVLACDGIWDVMSNSEVVKFVKNQMVKTDDLKVICNRLLDHCLAKGSTDNMSVVLIKLPGCPKRKDLKQKRKLELLQMHKAIKAKKLKQSDSRFPNIKLNQNANAFTNAAQVKPKGQSGPFNAYMRFYLDYLKTHTGNICQLAKRCGREWRNLDQSQKQIYRRRYLQAKRRFMVKLNKSKTSEAREQIPVVLEPVPALVM